jgi:RecA/RadA recombinase
MKKAELEDAIKRENKPASRIYYKTGCRLLDIMIGGGLGIGIPGGTIVNVIGDKSSGKSFLKNEILAANFHSYENFQWFSDDTESGDTFNTSELYGVNLRPKDRKIGGMKDVEDSNTVEELDAKLTHFLKSLPEDSLAIYAVDSLDGLSSNEQVAMAKEREKQLGNGQDVKDAGSFEMALQKFLSQHLFRGQHSKFEEKCALLLVVSQIRDKIGGFGFGQQYKVSGGRALEFYAHTRLFLKTVTKISKKDACIGLIVEAKLIKSKTPRPFRSCQFIVYFDYGIDDIGSSIDYLFDLRDKAGKLDTNAASSLRWGGGLKAPNNQELQEWIEKENFSEVMKIYFKENNLRATSAALMEFIDSNEEAKDKYLKTFGMRISRGELIVLCENDKSQKEILDKLVLEKWEQNEKELSSGRGKKYA